MPTQLRRRWFRRSFGLRTLFAVVTAVAIWLGWTVDHVRQRTEMLSRIESDGGIGMTSPLGNLHGTGSLPFSLWLVGVRPVRVIELAKPYARDEETRIEQLFPEAFVIPHTEDSGPLGYPETEEEWQQLLRGRSKK